VRTVYLDYNATTPLAPAVQEAMLPFLAEHYGNPSSTHTLGRACHEAVEDARTRVAWMLGAAPDEIVFTSGGTESNNLALKGLAFRRRPPSGHIIISAIEHPAISEPARFLETCGLDVTVIGCDAEGVVRPDDVAAALRDDTILVSVMLANNEIGSIQPIRRIADVCRARNVPVHTDAAQAIGKLPVNVDELGVDLLSIAGHKMYAPKGIGALYVRQGVALEPVLHGAGHEGGLRAGTENVAQIVGLGQAAALASEHAAQAAARMAAMRDRLSNHLRESMGDRVSFNGPLDARLPNTLSVNLPEVTAGEVLRRIPELCASTGAACHSGSTQLSATLAALGLSPSVARGTIRLSVGWYTSEEEIDWAAGALIAAWENLR